MRRIQEEELFKERLQSSDVSTQDNEDNTANTLYASNNEETSEDVDFEFDNKSDASENGGIYEDGNITPEDYSISNSSECNAYGDTPSSDNIEDPFQSKDKFIIRENYSCDVYDDDPIVRKSSPSITRDDLVVFAKLQSYHKKNRIKNIAGMIIAIILILTASSGLIMMAFSRTADAVIQSVEITSKETDDVVKGTATYKYTANGAEYTGKYNYRDKNIEYIPKEGGSLPVYYLRFAPSFSLEQRTVIPGFLEVVLLFAAGFILYDAIHGMAENRTIKKYFYERGIVWE